MAEGKIIRSPGVAEDLENICNFISKDSEYYAKPLLIECDKM